MVYPIDKVQYVALMADERFRRYNGLLFPEVFAHFYKDKDIEDGHNASYFFNNGIPSLVYHNREEKFVNQVIDYYNPNNCKLNRHIVSIENKPMTLVFIKEARINHFIDPHHSEKIFVHKSDFDFIQEYCLEKHLLVQNIRFQFKTTKNNIVQPICFQAINVNNKVIINQLVLASLLDKLGYQFSINRNNNQVCIPHDLHHHIKNSLNQRFGLIVFNNNPWYFFEKYYQTTKED